MSDSDLQQRLHRTLRTIELISQDASAITALNLFEVRILEDSGLVAGGFKITDQGRAVLHATPRDSHEL